MFTYARIKLTAWYLLIIMMVSISFSAFIYRGISLEFERRLNAIEARLELRRFGFFPPPGQVEYFIRDLEDSKEKILAILIYTNFVIFAFSGIAGYFLAGKTLQPIELAMDEQRRFIADASHEFKTPLTSLQTSIEVTLRDKKLNLKEAKNVLRDSLKDIQNLSSLSGYLLGLARFQKDNSFPKEIFNLEDPVKSAIKRLASQAKSNNISISTNLSSIKISANKESLEKLITILLDNSIKYSTKETTVNVEVKKIKGSAVISIKDHGVGISKKDISHIFERFYRADTSRSKEGVSGFGLGLAMAKQIVDLHNGEIKVESEFGKGSIFKVVLPL